MKQKGGRHRKNFSRVAKKVLPGYLIWKKGVKRTIGTIPLVNGLIKYCPVNELLGMNIFKKPLPNTFLDDTQNTDDSMYVYEKGKRFRKRNTGN